MVMISLASLLLCLRGRSSLPPCLHLSRLHGLTSFCLTMLLDEYLFMESMSRYMYLAHRRCVC